MEVKPIMTRKLRRRPNDPVPIPDKRRKPAPDILHISLLIQYYLFGFICLVFVLLIPSGEVLLSLKGQCQLRLCAAELVFKTSLTPQTSAKLFANRRTDNRRSKNT